MVKKPHIYIALPVMEESGNLPGLLSTLRNQINSNFTLVVCVNQYEKYQSSDDFRHICKDNSKSLGILEAEVGLRLHIIDKTSEGNGWPEKKGGVGWARKTIMDFIAEIASTEDIIVSIDADTYYPENYLEEVLRFFMDNKNIHGLAIPYYHPLGDYNTNPLILRYEIYMRYYLLNMMRIGNPYCFTAIGSAMAFPVWAYKKVGGLTPVVSGEDFYFLQKLSKSGPLGLWVNTIAYPSSRFSSRVVFGTGPALIKGSTGDWESYPVYNYKFFNEVEKTYQLFDELYLSDIDTPMDEFLNSQFGNSKLWSPLRNNYKDKQNFFKGCMAKIDGLRVLQYLRYRSKSEHKPDETNLFVYLKQFLSGKDGEELLDSLENFEYDKCSIDTLKKVREILFEIEMKERKTRFITYHINYA